MALSWGTPAASRARVPWGARRADLVFGHGRRWTDDDLAGHDLVRARVLEACYLVFIAALELRLLRVQMRV